MKNYMDKPKVKAKSLKNMDYLKLFSLVILCLLSLSAFPNDIDNVLKMTSAPNGVVFELIGSEDNKYLPNALKKVETYKGQLKKKFPAIEIAVVTHGAEQFELTKNNMNKNKKSQNLVKRITADNVPVHICATHASWRGVKPTDFPEMYLWLIEVLFRLRNIKN